MPTVVVHCKREAYDIYIGRPSKWGNIFSHLDGTLAKYKVSSRDQAIEKYKEWLTNQAELLASLHELKNKRLGCFCKPKKGFKGKLLCHGQILAGLCDNIKPEEVE